MNFFRFIDELLERKTGKPNTQQINAIYTALDKLTDDELTTVLKDIGTKMTDTMEFNFYGAHKINFDSLLKISKTDGSFTLKLPEFITALQSGDMNQLNITKEYLPEILLSYRFLDYLLSKVTHEIIRTELLRCRESCTLPFWRPSTQM